MDQDTVADLIKLTAGAAAGFLAAVMFVDGFVIREGELSNVVYHYQSLFGGVATFMAAAIAYSAANKAIKSTKAQIKRTEENYQKIVYVEALETHRKIQAYYDFIMRSRKGRRISEAAGEARQKADECAFDVPKSLMNYQVLSHLSPKVAEHAIGYRDALIEIKSSYYGVGAEKPVGMKNDCDKALQYFRGAFGVVMHAEGGSFSVDGHSVELRTEGNAGD